MLILQNEASSVSKPPYMDSWDNYIVEWFNSGFGNPDNWQLCLWGNFTLIVLSLVLTCVLVGLIGWEREYQGHSAGLRMHLLVALGSSIVMILSIYGFPIIWGDHRDPARLAASVVTGIGFLGAGTIVQTGVDIKGLTSATTVWVSMAIGMACGSGMFIVGILATVFTYICLVTMRKLEREAAKKCPVVRVIVPAERPVIREILEISNRYNIVIRDTHSELLNYKGMQAVCVNLRCGKVENQTMMAFVDEIRTSIQPISVNLKNII